MYGKEFCLWIVSILFVLIVYGFGWNYGYLSNCVVVEVYND